MTTEQNVSRRPLWRRAIDPDDPLLWAQRLNYSAIGLALTSLAISAWNIWG